MLWWCLGAECGCHLIIVPFKSYTTSWEYFILWRWLFSDVVMCSLVKAYWHFRGAFCLRHQAMRTWNLTFCLLFNIKCILIIASSLRDLYVSLIWLMFSCEIYCIIIFLPDFLSFHIFHCSHLMTVWVIRQTEYWLVIATCADSWVATLTVNSKIQCLNCPITILKMLLRYLLLVLVKFHYCLSCFQ
jgi:hypothetical protein